MFFLMAVLFIFSTAFAQQVQKSAFKIKDVTKVAPEQTGTSGEMLQATPAARNYDSPSRAPGDIIFSEDFNLATFPPAGWSRIHTGTDQTEQWARSATDGFGGTGCAYHEDFWFDNGDECFSFLITPAITLSAETEYLLQFKSKIQDWGGYYWYSGVYVSTTVNNNINAFTELDNLDDYSNNVWENRSFSLAAYAGQTVYLAFVYGGVYNHEWWVDDVAVMEKGTLPDNDLVLSAAKRYMYSMVPVNHSVPSATTFSATATNLGLVTQTNVELNIQINETTVATSTPISMPEGDSQTLTATTTAAQPVLMGANPLVYTLTQDQTDENPENNTAAFSFIGTENTFSMDNDVQSWVTAGSATAQFGAIFSFGQETTINQAIGKFYYAAGTYPAGANWNFYVYEITGAGTVNNTPLHQQTFTKVTNATAWATGTLNPPLTLPAGNYFVCVGGYAQLNPLFEDVSADRTTYDKVTTSATFTPRTTVGALMLRLNVDFLENDIRSVPNAFPYTMIPPCQVDLPFPATLTGKAQNVGSIAQTGVTLTVSYDGNTYGPSASIATLAVGATSADMTVNITPAPDFPPTALGTYNVNYTVSQNETDQKPENNTATNTFEVTENIFATDAANNPGAGVGGGALGAELGNIFTISNPTHLSNVIVGFSTSPNTLPYSIVIYRMTGATATEAAPILTASGFTRPSGGGIINHVVPETILTPGNYFLALKEGAAVNSGIMYDGAPGRPCYYRGSGTGAISPQASFGSLYIRMVLEYGTTKTITTLVSPEGAGTVTGGGEYEIGDPVTLTATPNDGYMWVKWSDGVTETTRSFTASVSATYTALFIEQVIPNIDACEDSQPIGTGTTTSTYLPAMNYNNRGYAQQIYDASEIVLPFVGATQINSISFNFNTATTPVWNEQTIYIGNTTKSTFESTTDWVPISQLQQVFHGTIAYNNTNTWFTIEFQEPFLYTGGNIVIAYLNNHGAYTTASNFRVHTATNKSLYRGYDSPNTAFDPAAPGTGTRPTTRSNVMFNACGVYPEVNMAAVSITGDIMPIAEIPTSYTITVENKGKNPATNYTVSLIDENNNVLNSVVVNTALPVNETAEIDIPVTFPHSAVGSLNIKGRVDIADDEIPADNETELLKVQIIDKCVDLANSPSIAITTGTVTTTYTLPANNLYNRSYTQQIYDAAELGLEPGTVISSISFLPTHSSSNIYLKPNQSIYLGNTTKSTFTSTTDYIPANELQLVVAPRDISFTHNLTPEWFTIDFDQSFTYTGDNIVVVYVNNHGAYASANTFRMGSNTGTKATGLYTDNATVISPSNIPTGTGVNNATYTYRNHVMFSALNFKEFPFDPILGTGAIVTLNTPIPVPCREEVLATFSSDPCYFITNILIDGVPVANLQSVLTNGYNFGTVTEPLPIVEVQTAPYHSDITVTYGPNGAIYYDNTIVSNGTVLSIDCVPNPVFSIKPDQGYTIESLLINGQSIPIPANKRYTFINAVGEYSIHATFMEFPQRDICFDVTGLGDIVQVVDGEHYILGDECTSLDSGTMYQQFLFIPATNYTLQAVYINGVYNMGATISGSYIFTNIVNNHNVTVIFKLEELTIFASAGANGTIEPSGNVPVPYGTNKLFNFIPNQGYVIDQVFVNNVSVPSAAIAGFYNFTNVTQNQTIYVTFKKATVVLHISWSDGGAVDPVGNVYQNYTGNSGDVYVFYNDIQQLTFAANEGYKVSMVYVNGVAYPNAILTGSYTFFYITEEQWLHVTFEKHKYPITSKINGNGMIIPQGTIYVDHGDAKTYTFYAMEGYKISNVFINGIDNEAAVANGTHTFYNVIAPQTIDVVTTPLVYTITAEAATGGMITPSGKVSVVHGNNQFFTFKASAGYEIEKVLVDGLENLEALQNGGYAFVNVKEDGHTINVFFKMLTFKVAALVNPNGNIAPAGVTEINFGEDITYTITPDEGYKISHVLVNGDNMGNIDTYTFAAIEADGDIEAFFVLIPPVDIIVPTIDGINIYSYTNVVYIINENKLPISDVSIFDMFGRVVWQGKPVDNKITLDVANGIYTVRLSSDDQFTAAKVSIQR